jgi:hypothetical protein
MPISANVNQAAIRKTPVMIRRAIMIPQDCQNDERTRVVTDIDDAIWLIVSSLPRFEKPFEMRYPA